MKNRDKIIYEWWSKLSTTERINLINKYDEFISNEFYISNKDREIIYKAEVEDVAERELKTIIKENETQS